MQKIPLKEVRFAVEVDFGASYGMKKMLSSDDVKITELTLTEDKFIVVKGPQPETVLIPATLCSKIVLCQQKENSSSGKRPKKAPTLKSKPEET